MAIRTKTVGTGITARETTVYSGDDMKPAAERISNNWNKLFQEGGGNFGAVTLQWIKVAKQIQDEFPDPHPKQDSPPWFAQLIMKYFRVAVAAKESGDTDSAMRWALELGVTMERFRIKCEWEDYALQGKKEAEDSSQGGRISSSRHAENRRRVLASMKTLVAKSHSVTNAARITHERGIGISTEANRKLWFRHKKTGT